jgi:G3E family GTPase
MSRRPPPPVPVAVLTGFLGAGKTTLLNRLLRDPALAGAMVVVNEIGEIGIDHLLVETNENVSLLSSGCLCCALRGDLVATLEDLCRRVDNGRLAPFPHLLIETTGLADPAPILATFAEHPYLRLRFSLAGVVTLVDALLGEGSLDAHPEAMRQVAAADRLVLTKTDLAGDAAAIRARLAALAPGVPVFDAAKGEASARALILDPADKGGAGWLGFAAARALAADAAEAARHAGHDCAALGCDSGPLAYRPSAAALAGLHAGVRSVTIRSARPLREAALTLFLELLRGAHGAKTLRLKGLVRLDDDPGRPVLVQGVQHVLSPPVRLDRWPDEDRDTRLVFILRDLDPAYVEALWGAVAEA